MKATGVKLLFLINIYQIISSTNLVYAKSSTERYKIGQYKVSQYNLGQHKVGKKGTKPRNTDANNNNLPVGSGGSAQEGDTNQHTAGDTDANNNNLPVGSSGSAQEGDTNQHTAGDTDANNNNLPVGSSGSAQEGDTNQYTAGDTDANNNNLPVGSSGSAQEGDTNQHTAGDTDANSNKPTKVSYNVAYPLGFTTSKLQGNMYVDLAIGAGFALGNAINITNTLTGTTEFVGTSNANRGLDNRPRDNRSGSAQDSNSVSTDSNNVIGVNFNAGIGYELIVKTRSKVNFYTALGFSYNLLSGHGASVSNSVNASIVNGLYVTGTPTREHGTYNSESTANISQADLLHIVGAKVKLGMSMLQDRLKVYGIVGLGALLPMHVTGNISINNNVSDVLTEVRDRRGTVLASDTTIPEESLQQDHAANLNSTTNAAFLPAGGIGISYDIVPRRLAIFFEFEGMPVIHTASTAVLNSNTFTNTGGFIDHLENNHLHATNTITSNTTTTSDGLTALFMLRTGLKLGF